MKVTHVEYGINAVLTLCAVTVGVVACVAGKNIKDDRLDRYRMHIYTSAIYCVGGLLWPVCFYFLAIRSYETLQDPYVVFGFAWPIALILMDVVFARNRSRRSEVEEESRANELRGSGSMLIGAAWAVGALLAIVASTGAPGFKHGVGVGGGGEGWSSKAAGMVLAALLMCIAFLIPAPENAARSYFNITYRAGQKVFLNWAVGLFVVGIVFAWRRK